MLHYVYCDFVLEGLPSDTEGKAWASVYRQSDLLTFAPCDVLDKVCAEYYRCRADAAAALGGLLLNGDGRTLSSSTAAATVGKVECCWQNPDNLNHRLNQGGSGNGREKENAKEKKDNSKVITLAIATVASSVNGDFDGSKAPTGTSTPLTTPVVTASGPFINFVLQPHVRARYKLEFAPGEERLKVVERVHRCYGHRSKAAMHDVLRLGKVKGSTTSDLDIFFSKLCPPCCTGS
ncbi:Proteophosphoglycan ppg4 [Rhodotorula toruloides ATCC 204091]|uniref:BY PROTMAP: gi/342319970/gb/EGU11915.1/ Proteophosphoglycan ppg4 [Rhodotorula glutinis ATCC 204091] n=1 Tax=Rhodotorula toruloides TaxID=5286 RepID=A0A0K3CNZ6_RHOTO|nr:Proteophosphoglycan ppg4 [Rhodotorula toruloides ATCC 204091]